MESTGKFLNLIISNLINEEDFNIRVSEEETKVKYIVEVEKEKIKYIMGYKGHTAKAIKTLVLSKENGKKVYIEIKEK